jgi:hypothetical protein
MSRDVASMLVTGLMIGIAVFAAHMIFAGNLRAQLLTLGVAGAALMGVQWLLSGRRAARATPEAPAPRREDIFAREADLAWTGLAEPLPDDAVPVIIDEELPPRQPGPDIATGAKETQ